MDKPSILIEYLDDNGYVFIAFTNQANWMTVLNALQEEYSETEFRATDLNTNQILSVIKKEKNGRTILLRNWN